MKVFLGLGSNIEPAVNIAKAKQALLVRFDVVGFSDSFESEPVGFIGENFINLVAEIDWSGSLDTLVELLKNLEDSLGRVRDEEKFSSRHIDIDILLFGDRVCQQPICLPREEIRRQAYVLWPLAELAPHLKEPGGQQTYAELWRAFDKRNLKVFRR